jgi:hypothetical protein
MAVSGDEAGKSAMTGGTIQGKVLRASDIQNLGR